MHITIAANTSAGSSDADAVEEVRRRLAVRHEVQVVEADGSDHLAALLTGPPDALVVAGGDGTVHAAVNALDRCGRLGEVPVGLVPLGTGNDLARTLGIPLDDVAAAADVVLSGVRRRLDTLRADTGELVVNAVHVGVGADAAQAAKPWKSRLGPVGYALGAALAGLRTGGRPIRVVADGRVLADGSELVLQVAVANGGYIGAGTPVAPDASPDDGWVDVVVSFAVPPVRRLGYAVRLRRGTHGERRDVVTARAREVAVSGPALRANADGELQPAADRRGWTLEPASLIFLTPPSP